VVEKARDVTVDVNAGLAVGVKTDVLRQLAQM
jgi:hypothetical protein